MKLKIADDLTFSAEAITETFAVLGIRGSGKTNTAVVMAEQMVEANQQVVVLDPTDGWFGMRSSCDGKSAGLQIIVAGGDHGDLPLEGANGHIMAEFVVESGASIIFSLRHLSMNDQRRFAQDFGEKLYDLKGKSRSPLHLFIDESDEFIPQRIPHGFERMFGAYDRLVRRGRIAGIGVTMISQRPQVINKDTLSQVGILICMRLMHKLDRKSVKESWIEGHDIHGRTDEFMESLASLERGEAWVWGTTYLDIFKRVHVHHRETFDSSFTPKAGEARKEATARAEVDLEALKKRLSATIEKAKADDPRELRRQIAQLKTQLGQRSPVIAVDEKAIRVAVEAERVGWERAFKEYARIHDQIGELSVRLAQLVAGGIDCPPPILAPVATNDKPRSLGITTMMRAERAAKSLNLDSGPTDGKLRAGAERMLAALAHWSPNSMSMGQMRAHAGMKKSGTFTTYLSDLRRGEYIEERNGEVYATRAGLEYCKHVPSAPASTDEVLAIWKPKLRDGARRMLDVLVLQGGEFVGREQLAEAAGMTKSGTFTTYLSDLRTARLVVIDSRGVAANKETLFL